LHLNYWYSTKKITVCSPDNENIIWHNKWNTCFYECL
jgi:hypothetical protein